MLRQYARRFATWVGGTGSRAGALEGRDGQLFLVRDTNNVMGQITGRLKAGRRRLAAIAACHKARAEQCAALGIGYRHVICPNKESIETDKLPRGLAYEAHGPSLMAQYLATSPEVAPFFDRSCLVDRADAYFRTDLHWTEVGAAAYLEAALRHWNDQRALHALGAAAAEACPIVMPTDLGSKLGLGPESSVGLHLPHESTTVTQTDVQNKGHVRWQRSERPELAGTRALVLHDSFGAFLYRILGELYAETLFIHDHDFDAAFVRRFEPDVVWLFQAERFLPRVPRNDIDFVDMIARNERRKKMPEQGSKLLQEFWPREAER